MAANLANLASVINLDAAQKLLLATELEAVVTNLRATDPGATPINWSALFAALLPILIQVLPLIIAALGGGSAQPSPAPAA